MPRLLVDTIGADVGNVPADTPTVAGYSTGGPGIQWSAADWGRFAGVKIRVDQSDSADPTIGDVADVETGAKTLQRFIEQARARRTLKLTSTLYIEASHFSLAQRTVAAAELDNWVWYWVANWALSQEEAAALLTGRIVAIQYASPISNPDTLLPGSRLTLAQANCDLSVARADWYPLPAGVKPTPKPKAKAKPVHPKVAGSTAGAAIGAGITAVIKAAGAHVDGAEAGAIATLATLLAGYLTPEKS